MQKDDNKIIFETPTKKMNKSILLSESYQMQSSEKKYFRRKSINTRTNLHTQLDHRKQFDEIEQRRQHAKSGFILGRKDIISVQKISEFKNKNSVNSIFKRRVQSESKVPIQKTPIDNFYRTKQSQSKINFAKKLIQDLKKATFKMKKNSPRYIITQSNNNSKSFDNNNDKNPRQNRQKLMQKSIEKLKPSFNINEVKFHSSKKLLRKSSRQSQQQTKTIRTKSRISKSRLGKQTLSQINNEQILNKMIKKSRQSLTTYSQFIKGSSQKKYKINVNYLSQYTKPQKSKSILSQIDFSALKLLSSIYLCLIDMLEKILQKIHEKNKPIKNLNEQIQVIKEYVQVYFHTYSRMKVEYIICEVVFKQARKRLYGFFIMQRIVFYWLHQNITNLSQKEDSFFKLIQFLKMSEQFNKILLNILFEQISCHNTSSQKFQNDNYNIVDTFRALKLVREMQKRSHVLRQIVDTVVLRNGQIESFKDIYISLMSFMQKIENDDRQSMIQLYQLEQYFNWNLFKIPPLFYLPPQPSKPYTLVIDLDGTLIYYNQQTKILKYRPYMDRFLTSMKNYFELIIFSSHPKERTDIIVQQIQRDEKIFQYRLYRPHMVFQQGGLRKNIGYLGRSVQRVILIDDQERNTEWLPLNSYKITTFTGDKKDKQLLNLSDWLIALIQSQPSDIRGKLKQKNASLDSVLQVDQASSTIQASIQYCQQNQTTTSSIKKKNM